MRAGRTVRTVVAIAAAAALLASGAPAATAGDATPPAPPPTGEAPPPAGPSTPEPGAEQTVEIAQADDLVTEIPEKQRDEALGDGWQESTDQAWNLTGDHTGLHVVVADGSDGYAWRTVATLNQPGFDTDRWIGNACLTESGERLVVAYAPRSFTNDAELFLQGAWTAVVDLGTGSVTDLPVRGSLEYFTPSCGYQEDAVITVSGGEEIQATRLLTVDAEAAQVAAPVEVDGQVTSAIPTKAGLVAAIGHQVARVDPAGRVTPLATARSVPFELTSDADGGVVFLDTDGTTATARRLDAKRIEQPKPRTEAPAIAAGPLTDVGVTRTAKGQVLLTGAAKPKGTLPTAVKIPHVGKNAEASAKGEVLVDVTSDSVPVAEPDGTIDVTAPLFSVETQVTSVETGETTSVDLVVDAVATALATDGAEAGPATEGAEGTEPQGTDTSVNGAAAVTGSSFSTTTVELASATVSRTPTTVTAATTATVPAAGTLAAASAADVNDPVDSARGCSVPRNSVNNQAVQPKPRQAEWAVNQAVKGALTVQRPANWKNLGMPAYQPQVMFPSVPLSGGGEVPSQIMLGILAQESNLWQANGYVVPGVTSSPLIGNYYGIPLSATGDARWDPDFSKVDCGYGIGQVTDGMRRGDTGMPGGRSWNEQRAIALDFAANIAAGMQILQRKWNQTYDAGMKIHDGNPAKIENWFYAIWAYNSGFYPEADRFTDNRNGAWGVGWMNNPANPSYPANRSFFHLNAADAANPQRWPYPEKVIGFAAFPPQLMESPGTIVRAFVPATWNGEGSVGNSNRLAAKPPIETFCQLAVNACDPVVAYGGGTKNGVYGACFHKDSTGQYDGRCWSHESVSWKTNCSYTCGVPFRRFLVGDAYQADGTAYAPVCGPSPLPSNALVIDDVPAGTPMVRTGCSSPVASAGTFEFTFSSGSDPTEFPSKMDLHQLGAGYGGHFWFGHTRNDRLREGSMEFTGTWTLGQAMNKWARVLVHIPDHGAHTQQATYVIDTGVGSPKERTILQRTRKNGWVSLGVMPINGVPSVSLSTETEDGDGPDQDGNDRPQKSEDIAFDAVAFVPLPGRPKDIVVALGDSYSSGEGAEVYYTESDNNGDDARYRNACHRSPLTWSRMARLPGSSATLGERADSFDTTLDYNLLACSGARTFHVWERGQYNELSQLGRGFIDANTTAVTISIGGNDAGFSSVVRTCLNPLTRCDDKLPLVPTFASTTEENVDNVVRLDVTKTLLEIHARGENADVLLMGYPQMFSSICADPTAILHPSEMMWLNSLATRLNDNMRLAADAADEQAGRDFVTFASPEEAFSGKGICGSPQQIHSINPTEFEGEEGGWWRPGSKSAHPTADGFLTYSEVATTTLAEMFE